MRKVTIDRTKWLRGKASEPHVCNVLWSENCNAGCCLGHAIHQITKLPLLSLANFDVPSQIFSSKSFLTFKENGKAHQNEFADKAININDSTIIPDEDRERLLIHLFKQNKIKLTFKN